MRITSVFLLIVAICLSISLIAFKPIGIFQDSLDIGKPKLAGSSHYDEVAKEYS